MLKKIGISLLSMLMVFSACAKRPEAPENQIMVIERPAISEIQKLSDLKKMIENEIASGKGFNYSETISMSGTSIYSFYTEDSMNHRSLRQTMVMNGKSNLIKYEIDDNGKFSSYDISLKEFKPTTGTALDSAAVSTRKQLLDFLRDDFKTERVEPTEDKLEFTVSGIAIEDAGTTFTRMTISYLDLNNGVVIFYLFSDSGIAMAYTISFAETGYDIGESLKDMGKITGE